MSTIILSVAIGYAFIFCYEALKDATFERHFLAIRHNLENV